MVGCGYRWALVESGEMDYLGVTVEGYAPGIRLKGIMARNQFLERICLPYR
jgi:hypothetical protein